MNQTHSRSPLCHGTPVVSAGPTLQVVSKQWLWICGYSHSGHVCHDPQDTVSQFMCPRSQCTGSGCSHNLSKQSGCTCLLCFLLMNNVCQKLRDAWSSKEILITTCWLSHPWFPHLIQLCVDHPQLVPYHQDLLSQVGHVSDGGIICRYGGSYAALPGRMLFRGSLYTCSSS